MQWDEIYDFLPHLGIDNYLDIDGSITNWRKNKVAFGVRDVETVLHVIEPFRISLHPQSFEHWVVPVHSNGRYTAQTAPIDISCHIYFVLKLSCCHSMSVTTETTETSPWRRSWRSTTAPVLRQRSTRTDWPSCTSGHHGQHRSVHP